MRRLIRFVHFVAVVSCCPSSGRHSVAPLTLCSYSCCFPCFPSCSSENQHYFWRDLLFPIYCGISLSESNNSISGTCFWAPILLQGQSLEMHVPHTVSHLFLRGQRSLCSPGRPGTLGFPVLIFSSVGFQASSHGYHDFNKAWNQVLCVCQWGFSLSRLR